MQRFGANGEKLGAEEQVAESTLNHQNQPSVDALEEGGFVVSWTGYNAESKTYDIFTQRYTNDGIKVESIEECDKEYAVTQTEYVNESNSEVAGLSDGGYVVVWTSYGQDGSYDGVYMQRFGANIRANIRANIWDNIRANIGDNIRANIWDNIRDNIGANIRDNIRDNIGANIRANIRANIGDNIRANIGDNIRANIGDNL